jgi:hypothetical protein
MEYIVCQEKNNTIYGTNKKKQNIHSRLTTIKNGSAHQPFEKIIILNTF